MTWSQFLPAFAALFVIVMLRANATYWLGRGAAAGSRRWRKVEGDGSPAWQRARDLVNRWGPIAVVLCFFTVGIQTAVNATAGVTRMPLRRYLPAVTLGSIVWATIYATVGLAAARAWLAAAARSPVGATLAAVALVAVVVTIVVVHRRRARRPAPSVVDGTDRGMSEATRGP
ncbi:DedA family protein [Janibacter indicus]|uniref:Membrane protein DedA, SNARE-associated domain n=1 Tax=Janibacter indicus TaxID=857417 RepID=A0A1W2CFJ0_9MICO|nr:VTT domain-containing protein [Janibacter indicus]SMC83744.1 membrane protein DedA, SNARE-associated domain [Janibacter indicus]